MINIIMVSSSFTPIFPSFQRSIIPGTKYKADGLPLSIGESPGETAR